MEQRFPARHRRPSACGYMLVVVMFLLFAFVISLSIAAPAIARSIQLDRERETIERGKQYQRAIQLYYRRFHAYPPTIDALAETNNIRFLRKRYIDPMTRKDDWRPILFGQNKAPTAMGFFGEPLNGMGSTGASTLAGIGPSGTPGLAGSSTTIGSSSLFNSGTGSSGNSGLFAPSTSSGNSGSPGLGTGAQPGQGSSSGTGSDPNTQSFGGAGIIGVSPGTGAASITIYKRKNRYDQWEFTYDPMSDMALMRNNSMVNQPAAGSVVGVGSGPNGTGPVVTPNSPPAATPVPQQ